ncbi:DUF5011 domain-containing protein [Bifidobacterium sp. 82T25]|nr:DUF5011 domain-containing protein [Bifidobacterium miconisargentati]
MSGTSVRVSGSNGDTFTGSQSKVSSGTTLGSQGTRYLELTYEGPADTDKPVIKGADDKTITVGDPFDPKAGVTATDETDGDITSKITISGSVDVTKPGKYELNYTVSDNAGNKTEVKRVITVTPVMNANMPETGSVNGFLIGGRRSSLLWHWAPVSSRVEGPTANLHYSHFEGRADWQGQHHAC